MLLRYLKLYWFTIQMGFLWRSIGNKSPYFSVKWCSKLWCWRKIACGKKWNGKVPEVIAVLSDFPLAGGYSKEAETKAQEAAYVAKDAAQQSADALAVGNAISIDLFSNQINLNAPFRWMNAVKAGQNVVSVTHFLRSQACGLECDMRIFFCWFSATDWESQRSVETGRSSCQSRCRCGCRNGT